MKKMVFLTLMFGLCSNFGFGIYVKNPVYELAELELTDSLPIRQIVSLMTSKDFPLEETGLLAIQLDIIQVDNENSCLITLSIILPVEFATKSNRIGVFDYQGKSVYVKGDIMPDFLRKTDRKRKFDWRTNVFKAEDGVGYNYPMIHKDTPEFVFQYKAGEIMLEDYFPG